MCTSLPQLYADWWTGEAEAPPNVAPKAAPTRYHRAEEWTAIEEDGFGGVVIARDGEIAVADAGEWSHGRADRVLLRRRRQWDENGFRWTASQRPAPAITRRWRVRIYVPGGHESAHSEFENLVGALEQAGYSFEAKVRLGAELRRDQCVFWLAARDALAALDVMLGIVGHSDIREAPPPLTLQISRLGIAHDPAGGGSLGLRACAAIVGALDQDGTDEPHARWKRACRFYGLEAECPWRHPGSVDPFDIWAAAEELAR